MTNPRELLINVVIENKPTVLTGLTKMVRGQAWKLHVLPCADAAPPANRQNLTHHGVGWKTGEPRMVLLWEKPSRKVRPWVCGQRNVEKANAVR